MSRASQWADDGQNKKSGTLELINSDGLSIDVYRRGTQSGRAGFTSEANEAVFLRTVNGRIDLATQNSDPESSDMRTETVKYVGLTDDPDAREGDLWEWAALDDSSTFGKVVRVLPIEAGSQCWLEMVKR